MTGKELLKVAQKNGWLVIRQKGSHIRLMHSVTKQKETIYLSGNRDLPKGTLSKLLKTLYLKNGKGWD